MPSLIFQIISWPVLGTALVVFGFAPGAVLRLTVLAYPRDDPRRRELLGELYAVPRIERPFWVAEKLELALIEGLGGRLRKAIKHRRPRQNIDINMDTAARVLALAQQTADQAVKDARREADETLGRARREADEILGKARRQANEIRAKAQRQA
jgi:hypothetical protein